MSKRTNEQTIEQTTCVDFHLIFMMCCMWRVSIIAQFKFSIIQSIQEKVILSIYVSTGANKFLHSPICIWQMRTNSQTFSHWNCKHRESGFKFAVGWLIHYHLNRCVHCYCWWNSGTYVATSIVVICSCFNQKNNRISIKNIIQIVPLHCVPDNGNHF